MITARLVAPGGRIIGLDAIEEMLELARSNATVAGITHAEFRPGYIEDTPLPDGRVGWHAPDALLSIGVWFRRDARALVGCQGR